MTPLIRIAERLRDDVNRIRIGSPVTHVYNPLEYAFRSHAAYLERYGAKTPRQVLLLGMNPGPFGMAQTGVPFGEVALVRDWLGITAKVDRPKHEHDKRPIEGFDCKRSEVSGARLWGWAKDRFGTPERFFERFFVANYCPLVFMEQSGKNRTPDKLPAGERSALFAACDKALADTIAFLAPSVLIGVGAFAEERLQEVAGQGKARIGRILHPSPASPLANKGWPEAVVKDLAALGVKC